MKKHNNVMVVLAVMIILLAVPMQVAGATNAINAASGGGGAGGGGSSDYNSNGTSSSSGGGGSAEDIPSSSGGGDGSSYYDNAISSSGGGGGSAEDTPSSSGGAGGGSSTETPSVTSSEGGGGAGVAIAVSPSTSTSAASGGGASTTCTLFADGSMACWTEKASDADKEKWGEISGSEDDAIDEEELLEFVEANYEVELIEHFKAHDENSGESEDVEVLVQIPAHLAKTLSLVASDAVACSERPLLSLENVKKCDAAGGRMVSDVDEYGCRMPAKCVFALSEVRNLVAEAPTSVGFVFECPPFLQVDEQELDFIKYHVRRGLKDDLRIREYAALYCPNSVEEFETAVTDYLNDDLPEDLSKVCYPLRVASDKCDNITETTCEDLREKLIIPLKEELEVCLESAESIPMITTIGISTTIMQSGTGDEDETENQKVAVAVAVQPAIAQQTMVENPTHVGSTSESDTNSASGSGGAGVVAITTTSSSGEDSEAEMEIEAEKDSEIKHMAATETGDIVTNVILVGMVDVSEVERVKNSIRRVVTQNTDSCAPIRRALHAAERTVRECEEFLTVCKVGNNCARIRDSLGKCEELTLNRDILVNQSADILADLCEKYSIETAIEAEMNNLSSEEMVPVLMVVDTNISTESEDAATALLQDNEYTVVYTGPSVVVARAKVQASDIPVLQSIDGMLKVSVDHVQRESVRNAVKVTTPPLTVKKQILSAKTDDIVTSLSIMKESAEGNEPEIAAGIAYTLDDFEETISDVEAVAEADANKGALYGIWKFFGLKKVNELREVRTMEERTEKIKEQAGLLVGLANLTDDEGMQISLTEQAKLLVEEAENVESAAIAKEGKANGLWGIFER